MLEKARFIYSHYINGIASYIDGIASIELLFQIGVPLTILTTFLILRRVFTNYIFGLLLRISSKTKSSLDNHLITAFEKPFRFFFVLLGLYLSLLYLPLSSQYDLFLSRFFRSSLIIIISTGFYNFFGSHTALGEDLKNIFGIHLERILLPFFSNILKALTVVITLSIIAQEWNYDINSLIAGLGLGGLAFALAAKDTVSNIFGGIVIITDKPFSIGDWILTSSVEGIVEDINFRSTKIRTFAQALVTVPNATLANEPITNWTRMGTRRITFNLGVTYNTSREKLEKCIAAIRTMLENHSEIHQDTIFVRFNSFGESSLDIFLYFFTKTTVWGEYLRVKEDINFRIMNILEDNQVSVAFPSNSIYFETSLEAKQTRE